MFANRYWYETWLPAGVIDLVEFHTQISGEFLFGTIYMYVCM